MKATSLNTLLLETWEKAQQFTPEVWSMHFFIEHRFNAELVSFQ